MLTDQEKLPEALDKINVAIVLNPSKASFDVQRGNILQSMERFNDAADAYAAALRLNPQEANAAGNLELSRLLAAEKQNEGSISINTRTKWRDALISQGRTGEAIINGRGLAADAKKTMPAWQAKIDAWLGKNAPQLQFDKSRGLFSIDLANLSIVDISPLRGMPLEALTINGNSHIRDLGPLADCPLTTLHANDIHDLMDLSPLNGKKVTHLQISQTGIRELSPLAGNQALNFLYMKGVMVSDLTPLREARLKLIDASDTMIRSLEPLRGQPLESVSVNSSRIVSLAPIGDAPITTLSINFCGPLDLADLRKRQLRRFFAEGTILDHLEVLSEMTELEIIVLPKNLTDPNILRKLSHLRKIDRSNQGGKGENMLKDAADFWKEYDAQHPAE